MPWARAQSPSPSHGHGCMDPKDSAPEGGGFVLLAGEAVKGWKLFRSPGSNL